MYLNVGDPADALTFEDTPEGHNVGSNAVGDVVSISLLHPRWLLEQEGKVAITLPSRVEISAATLDQALVAAT